MMMIGTRSADWPSVRQISSPSMPGSIRSSSTRSGPKRRTCIQCLAPVCLRLDVEAVEHEVVAHQPRNRRVVFDDENALAHACVCAGSAMVTTVPSPTMLRMPIVPP